MIIVIITENFNKIQEFLYPEYDPDLSQNLITCSFGQAPI